MVGITAVRPYPPLSENVHECEELRGNGWFYSRGLGRSVGMLLQQLPMRLCQQMERGIRRRNLLPEGGCGGILGLLGGSSCIHTKSEFGPSTFAALHRQLTGDAKQESKTDAGIS